MEEIIGYTVEILGLLGVVIEITPVKFSPLKWIGNRLNSGIKKELDSVKENLAQLQHDVDYNDIGTIRNRIC